MTRIVWSTAAQRDLSGIVAYYAEFGPDLALRMIATVEAAAFRLVDHPRLGPELPDSHDRAWLVRGSPFILIYRPTGGNIRVLQVRHAASDWKPPS